MQLLQQLMRQLGQLRLRDHKPPYTGSRPGWVLAIAVISLTSALGHRFYNTPKLDIGKASPQTIVAPAAATVEDKKATEEKRKVALKNTVSVLMVDDSINEQISQSLQRQLEDGNELRQVAGPFPYAKTSLLSIQRQSHLRKISPTDWQKVVRAANAAINSEHPKTKSASPSNISQTDFKSLNSEQQRAVADLQTYRRATSAEEYASLLQTIAQIQQGYSNALSSLPQPIVGQEKSLNASLLELPEPEWKRMQAVVTKVAERMLAQGIPVGLPEAVLEDAVTLNLESEVSDAAQPVATHLLLNVLQPNLIPDEVKTLAQAEQAAQKVEPEMVTIRQGEVIIRAGETIKSDDFALLDHFSLSRRGIDWVGLVAFGGLVSGAVVVYWIVEQRFQPKFRQRDRILILLLTLSTPLLIALRVPSTNLPAIGLLVSTFYGQPVGVVVTGMLTVLLPIGMPLPWSDLVASAAGGILCGILAGRLRSREELALLGTAVGALQGVLYLLLNVASGTVWYTLLGAAAIRALLGLAWSIVAIGSSPYLEQMFDLVTTIRLVELANPNRPLLKRLAAEAPGTFQHTLFVATLAEAAARTLGCNVELVRTGTLYHDIGKMHDPMGFIENQRGGPNKHDRIDNPWESARIIKKHVTEGLVMARKCRLPKAVQAFIPEHQGTMLIAYFYHQAQQKAQHSGTNGKTPSVQESDFRYNGPTPQSRETGIVMLADSCEAALRSLKDATPEEALSMINKILRARWQDQQLAQSGLTRENMTQIANVFVEVWQQFNHQRIVYPKAAVGMPPPTTSK